MSFNLDKCHVVTFGNLCEDYNYTMKKSGTPLTLNRCNEECNLGAPGAGYRWVVSPACPADLHG